MKESEFSQIVLEFKRKDIEQLVESNIIASQYDDIYFKNKSFEDKCEHECFTQLAYMISNENKISLSYSIKTNNDIIVLKAICIDRPKTKVESLLESYKLYSDNNDPKADIILKLIHNELGIQNMELI